MNKRKSKNTGGIVYSTSENFKIEEQEDEIIAPEPGEQILKVRLDKKQRGGKIVTLIEGLRMSDGALEDLSRQLKTHCGGGGSAKNGEILIQGDHRDKIVQWLLKKGFSKTKKV
jgi:translation initiation factor 1